MSYLFYSLSYPSLPRLGETEVGTCGIVCCVNTSKGPTRMTRVPHNLLSSVLFSHVLLIRRRDSTRSHSQSLSSLQHPAAEATATSSTSSESHHFFSILLLLTGVEPGELSYVFGDPSSTDPRHCFASGWWCLVCMIHSCPMLGGGPPPSYWSLILIRWWLCSPHNEDDHTHTVIVVFHKKNRLFFFFFFDDAVCWYEGECNTELQSGTEPCSSVWVQSEVLI